MKSTLLIMLLFAAQMNAASTLTLLNHEANYLKALEIAQPVLMLDSTAITCPRDIADVQVFHHKGNFYTLHEGVITKIENYNLSKELCNISSNDVQSMLKSDGYVRMKKSSDGSYHLELFARLIGGGPITGLIALWGTKVICYTAYVVGIGVAGTVSGPAATGGAGLLIQTGATAKYIAFTEATADTLGTAAFLCPWLP